MSVDMFLKLDGIDGESIKTGFEKWIEISSFSNGVSNHALVSHGTGSGAGKADVSSISMQKMLDRPFSLSSARRENILPPATWFAANPPATRQRRSTTNTT
jgi:hypothetical protein